jgi:hypothetical protein
MARWRVDIRGKELQQLGTVDAPNAWEALARAVDPFDIRPALRSKTVVTKLEDDPKPSSLRELALSPATAIVGSAGKIKYPTTSAGGAESRKHVGTHTVAREPGRLKAWVTNAKSPGGDRAGRKPTEPGNSPGVWRSQSGDCASRTGPLAPRDRLAMKRGRSRVVLTGTFTIVRALD